MRKNSFAFIVLLFLLVFNSFSCERPTDNPIKKHEAKVVWSYPVLSKSFPEVVMPVVENGYTYVAVDSTITRYELKTGKIIWQSELDIGGNRMIRSRKLLSSGNYLYLNHADWVKAFDKSNGNLVWYTTIENFDDIDMSIMSQNTNSLLLGGQGEVIKISKTTGNIELRIKLEELIPTGYFQLAYNPVLSEDNFIYVPTGWFTGSVVKGNILCYNADNGKYLWGFEGPSFDIASCAFKDSLLVFPSSSRIFALNRFTGSQIWSTSINSDDAFGLSITIHDESLYIGTQAKAFMYAFDLRTGKLKWKSEPTKSSILTIITVKDNRVYFSNNAYIYVLEATTGSVIWKGFPPDYTNDGNTIYSSPVAVGDDYMVCVGNKKVYCLTVP